MTERTNNNMTWIACRGHCEQAIALRGNPMMQQVHLQPPVSVHIYLSKKSVKWAGNLCQ